jgi:D-glycero-D-manno-heptose 1,7-bisphosphate phosphatase
MSLSPAIFLDRDGVLNKVVWRDGKAASPRTLQELHIEDEAEPVLARLRAAGFRLFAVTNQPDVARGLMSASTLEAINRRLLEILPLEAVRACLHDNADGCACRKPRPGLVLALAEDYRLDLRASWMIGDQDRDIACGRDAGLRTVLLRRSYSGSAAADHVVASLSDAADVILDPGKDHE